MRTHGGRPGKSDWAAWLTAWGAADRPRLYRAALEKCQWAWTPEEIARMPVPQMLLVFGPEGEPIGGLAGARKLANERRAKRGLPPITPKGKG